MTVEEFLKMTSSPTWRMPMKPVGIIGDYFGLRHSSLTKND
jgi:hypothetical protein